jgi:hypothetical protein
VQIGHGGRVPFAEMRQDLMTRAIQLARRSDLLRGVAISRPDSPDPRRQGRVRCDAQRGEVQGWCRCGGSLTRCSRRRVSAG